MLVKFADFYLPFVTVGKKASKNMKINVITNILYTSEG
jgi:hypothetical protein